MLDKSKSSFYRKLSPKFKKDYMEIIKIFNMARKSMLKEIEGKRKND